MKKIIILVLTFIFLFASCKTKIDVAETVGKNLDILTSSPMFASNILPYIEAHQAEYDEIVALGNDALEYMFSVFEKGNQNGLRGWIMALACCDILGIDTAFENPTAATGQEWYDQYKTKE